MRNQTRTRTRFIERSALRALRLFVCMTLLLAFAGSAAAQQVWDGSADVSWYDIHTTEFTLSTPEQLAGLARLVKEGDNFRDKTIRLAADILLNDTEGWESWGAGSQPANTWTPIGYGTSEWKEVKFFSGTFDGQGHVVRGLYIPDEYCAGLFGIIGYSTVRNLKVTESYVSGGRYVGGIVGFSYYQNRFERCEYVGTVRGGEATIFLGGITGYTSDECVIADCRVEGLVSGDDGGVLCLGGIVGAHNGLIENCRNDAEVENRVKGLEDVAYAGGIVGDNRYGSIKKCVNNSRVAGGESGSAESGGIYVGGISGGNTGGGSDVYECENKGTVEELGRSLAIGGITGYNSGGDIYFCRNTGEVRGGSTSTGGIVGIGDDWLGLVGCFNAGTVTGSAGHIGGIAGWNKLNCAVECSYNHGEVKKIGDGDAFVGGIVGYNGGETWINACYSLSPLETGTGGTVTAGNITGYNESWVENSYFITDDPENALACIGGGILTGDEHMSYGFKSHDAFKSGEVAFLLGKDNQYWGQSLLPGFEDDGPTLQAPKVVEDGNGGYTNALATNKFYGFLIRSANDLRLLAQKVNAGETFEGKTVTLMNDITLNDTQGWENWDGDTPGLNAWTPIGRGVLGRPDSKPFKGTFDGKGFRVRGIYTVSDNDDPQGLFAYVDGGKVMNVGVEESFMKGVLVGGVVGFAFESEISGCHHKGRLEGLGGCGGIVGSALSGTTVSNCYNEGAIKGQAEASIGGIAARSLVSDITDCYNTAAIDGDGDVGGIVGYCGAIRISRCYNAATVKGTRVGGIAGNNDDSAISACYNRGVVEGTRAGGIAGQFVRGNNTITGCYYLEGTSEYSVGYDSYVDGNKEGLMARDRFLSGEVAFLLGEGWGQDLDAGAPFPVLGGRKVVRIAENHYMNTLKEDSRGRYLIGNAVDLRRFATLVNAGETFEGKTVLLTNDIALNNTKGWENWDGDTQGLNAWTPIGYAKMEDGRPFMGIFDGQGYCVKGLYIASDEPKIQSLFGNVYGGEVTDVGVEESFMKGLSVCGIVGQIAEGKISDCYFAGTLDGLWQSSGIALSAYSSVISNCYNKGTIRRHDEGSTIGGIIGSLSSSTISDCRNMAAIEGGRVIGGIVGHSSNSEISNCYNTGAVKGNKEVGGIVGIGVGSGISACYNRGMIEGDESVGGIVGLYEPYEHVVTDCFYLEGTSDYGIGSGFGFDSNVEGLASPERFHSGEIAYRLGGNWRQALGDGHASSYPVLSVELGYIENMEQAVYAITFPNLSASSRTRYSNCDAPIALPVEELLTPEEQSRFERWSVTDSEGQAVGVTDNVFVMPSSDVTVVAEFVYVPSYYSLYIEPNDSVRLTADATTVEEGYAFTLTAEVAAGYDPSTLLVEYRESFYGSWNALAPSADGTYRIASVYDDIYVRASVLPEELPTGIEGVEGLKVYTEDGILFVQTPGSERVTVVSLAGHLVASETQSGLRRYTGLASGAYLVRVGERTVKIRIR